MSDYIIVSTTLADSPIIARIAGTMGVNRHVTTGMLMRFWLWAVNHGKHQTIHAPCTCGETNETTATISGHARGCGQQAVIDGIGTLVEHSSFVSALYQCDLIEIDADEIRLVNYETLVRFPGVTTRGKRHG